MKTISWSSLLAVGLSLATVQARAGMTQYSGGNWSQQTTAQGASGGSQPGSHERGYQMSGQPTMSAQFAQPGHSLVQSQTGPVPAVFSGNGDAHHGGHFVHGGDFGHGHFGHHRHPIVVFVNGAAWWYPVYTDYPYGSDVTPPVVSSGAYYTGDDGYVPAPVSDTTDAGPAQAGPDFSDLGLSWGQDLRREVATWNQFVAYLKAYVITAPPSAQADFREAFIYAYRINGAAAYDKAASQAANIPSQPPGPKVITFPPPPPPSY
jgi:hypothetical protein